MGKGVDLLALALLMATLRDWFVICQRRVPVVCMFQRAFAMFFSLVLFIVWMYLWEGGGERENGPEDQG